MINQLNFRIARTHLLAKKKQTAVAALGVTFGIAMFVYMISVMTGVNILLEDTMLMNTPHIRMYNDVTAERPALIDTYYPGDSVIKVIHHQRPKQGKRNIKGATQILARLRADDKVAGVSAQVNSQVFYNYGPVQLNGTIAGVDILAENEFSDLQSKMKSGTIRELNANRDGLIMGIGLAKKLNIKKGDRVTVSTPSGGLQAFKVVGIFKTAVGAIDDQKSYANTEAVQKILEEDSRFYTEIQIKLKDINAANPYAAMLQRQYGYEAQDWETANATILQSFVIRNVMTVIVAGTLLVVAGFGIYNIMNMTIYNKMRDIAILKATGFAGKDIKGIFMTQSIIIGLLGGSLGLIFGYIFSYLTSKAPFDGGEVLSIDTFPVNMDYRFYVLGMVFGVVTTALAAYFPSRKASKIDPVNILRG